MSSFAQKESVREQLSAAEETFRLCEGTIVQNENEELCGQRRLLDITWNPQLQLHHAVLPQYYAREEDNLYNQQKNLREEQEEPAPLQVKEEQEDQEFTQIEENKEKNREQLSAAKGTIIQNGAGFCRQRRLMDLIWKVQSQIHSTVLPQHYASEEDNLYNRQKNLREEQEEPAPLQIKEEQEEPEFTQIEENKEKNREQLSAAEGTIIQNGAGFCRQRRLMDLIWKVQSQINVAVLPQHYASEEDNLYNQQKNLRGKQEEPETSQFKEEQEDQEFTQIEEKHKKSKPLQIKDKLEQQEPPQIKEKTQAETQQFRNPMRTNQGD
ncbi:hypothetical protein OJAV_G00013430, partial [Oryzias javanicus]